ncbi:MAG: carbohydrate ABC transporter permease [Ruminiclostridium sp.]
MDSYRKNWKIAFFLLFPSLALYTLFMLVPVIQSTVYAFTDWNGLGKIKFIGLEGFINLFKDENFYISLRNNIYLLISSIFLIIPISLILAVILSKEIKGHKFFRSAFFLPQILSTVVVALIWSFVYNPQFGLLNSMLKSLGLEEFIRLWLADRSIAIFSVLVVNAWYYIGLIMIILLSAINNIPIEIFEAADIDGFSETSRTFYITIPLIWDTIKVTVLLGIAGSMKAFDLVYVLTQGGPGHSTELLATYMYKQAFVSFNYGYGSTITTTIFALSFILTILMQRFMKNDVVEF